MVVMLDLSTENYSSATGVGFSFTRLSDPNCTARSFGPVPQVLLFLWTAFAVGEMRKFDPNIARLTRPNWNFAFAQLGNDWKIEASYIGNHAVGQWRGQNIRD
jgi:hypothetical protein